MLYAQRRPRAKPQFRFASAIASLLGQGLIEEPGRTVFLKLAIASFGLRTDTTFRLTSAGRTLFPTISAGEILFNQNDQIPGD